MPINLLYPVIHQNKECLKLGAQSRFLLLGHLCSSSPVCLELCDEMAGQGRSGAGRERLALLLWVGWKAVPPHLPRSCHSSACATLSLHSWGNQDTKSLNLLSWLVLILNYPYHEVRVCRNSVPSAEHYEGTVNLLLHNNSVQANLTNTECLIFARPWLILPWEWE